MRIQGAGQAIAARPFGRRQFLAATGGLAATGMLLGPNGFTQDEDGPLGEAVRTAGRALSVGYVVGSDAAESALGALARGARVVPATLMRSGSGDQSVRGPAQIGVLGATAGVQAAVDAGMKGLHLDALVPAPKPLLGKIDGPDLLPFYAWSLTASPASVHTTAGTSFAIDFDRSPRLGFKIEGVGTGLTPGTAAFTTGSHSGMAKLRHGLYLLAVGEGVWDKPRALPDPADEAGWAGLVSLLVSVSPA